MYVKSVLYRIISNVVCIVTVICKIPLCASENQEMTGHIVGGVVVADMRRYPHAAALTIKCSSRARDSTHACGSSIINQYFLVTAAHCFETCYPIPKSYIGVTVGSEDRKKYISTTGKHFIAHERYDSDTVYNDIGLIRLSHRLKFGQNIKKLAVMKRPPLQSQAEVAGWGLTDEKNRLSTNKLKATEQQIWTRDECHKKILKSTPPGTLCGGYKHPKGKQGYVAQGDSGSGLLVKQYILVGLVSYKLPKQSASVSIFTDVSHFYDWIVKTTARVQCQYKKV